MPRIPQHHFFRRKLVSVPLDSVKVDFRDNGLAPVRRPACNQREHMRMNGR